MSCERAMPSDIPAFKKMTMEQYTVETRCHIRWPIVLMVPSATEDELERFPAKLSPLDGWNSSAYIQAVWSTITQGLQQGLPAEGIVLTIEAVSSQQVLSEIIAALYTGNLQINKDDVVAKLKCADFLQIQALVDLIHDYIISSLVLPHTSFACSLSHEFSMSRSTDGGILAERIGKQILANCSYCSSEQLELESWKENDISWKAASTFLTEMSAAQSRDFLEKLLPLTLCVTQAFELLLLWIDQHVAEEEMDVAPELGNFLERKVEFFERSLTRMEADLLGRSLSSISEQKRSPVHRALFLLVQNLVINTLRATDINDKVSTVPLDSSDQPKADPSIHGTMQATILKFTNDRGLRSTLHTRLPVKIRRRQAPIIDSGWEMVVQGPYPPSAGQAVTGWPVLRNSTFMLVFSVLGQPQASANEGAQNAPPTERRETFKTFGISHVDMLRQNRRGIIIPLDPWLGNADLVNTASSEFSEPCLVIAARVYAIEIA